MLSGRPHGGCALIWKATMKNNVKVIKTNNNRICPVKLSVGNTVFLVLNVYMPCDSRCMDNNYDMFDDVMNEIGTILLKYS